MLIDSDMDRPDQALAQEQNALLQVLFTAPADGALLALTDRTAALQAFNQRGLRAYQAHGQALAERALAAAYPVTQQLLGAESFGAMARALWQAHPPVCGDLAHWGGNLAGFVAVAGPLEDAPYVPDVARVEWALHASATLPDANRDGPSLQRLQTDDPACLMAQLAPGCVVVPSPWPVASIVAAHRAAGAGAPSADCLADLGRRVRACEAETAIVWRQGHAPCTRPAVPGEAVFLVALLGGTSLAEALHATQGRLDLAVWLAQAVHSGLLLGIADLP